MEEFEHKGAWFVPERPEQRLSGTLTFSLNEGGVLEPVGSFEDEPHMGSMLRPDLIPGESSDGRRITLCRCFEFHKSTPTQGPQPEPGAKCLWHTRFTYSERGSQK